METNLEISKVELEQLSELLRQVVDPEIGINILDLGLIYEMKKKSETDIELLLTLTSPACPLSDMIEDQINSVLILSGLYSSVDIKWTWMPPWTMEKITEEGKQQMRSLGFGV